MTYQQLNQERLNFRNEVIRLLQIKGKLAYDFLTYQARNVAIELVREGTCILEDGILKPNIDTSQYDEYRYNVEL